MLLHGQISFRPWWGVWWGGFIGAENRVAKRRQSVGHFIFSRVEFWHGAASLWVGKCILFKGALIALLKYRVGLMFPVAFSQDLYLVGRLKMPLRATLIAQSLLAIFLSNVSSKYFYFF